MWRRIITTSTGSSGKNKGGERQQAAAPSYLSSEIMFPRNFYAITADCLRKLTPAVLFWGFLGG